MKIIIFGTSGYAERMIYNISKDIEIVAASDNDSSKWWTSWHGITIIPPHKLREYVFDYIVVASMYSKEIVEGLLNIGFDRSKIIGTYNHQYEENFEQQHEEVLSKLGDYWREQKKRYGELNPDKTFYILRKYPEAMGLLSCYLTYLGQLELIAKKKYIPLVDMMSNYYPMSHNSPQDVNKVNAWEQFFEQLSGYDLTEVYDSRHVILGFGYATHNAMEFIDETAIPDELILKWHDLDKRYIKLKPELKEQFQEEYEQLFGGKRIIGVMIREPYVKFNQLGMDTIKGHPVQPELEDVSMDLERWLNEWNCDYIFISTESKQTIEYMQNRFGDKLLYTKRFRRDMLSKDYNDFIIKSNEYLNSMTVQQRNIDYLKEVYLLSKCTCLTCGKASATVVASIWNGNQYEHRKFYELGTY